MADAWRMGAGIDQVCAMHAIPSSWPAANRALERAQSGIAHNLERQVAKGKLTGEARGATSTASCCR